jgi:hypothetical protein
MDIVSRGKQLQSNIHIRLQKFCVATDEMK